MKVESSNDEYKKRVLLKLGNLKVALPKREIQYPDIYYKLKSILDIFK